jgi:hypothetical protein
MYTPCIAMRFGIQMAHGCFEGRSVPWSARRLRLIEGEDQSRARERKARRQTANASRVYELRRPLASVQQEDWSVRLRISEAINY